MMNPTSNLSLLRKLVYSVIPVLLLLAVVEGLFRLLPQHEDSGDTIAGLVEPDEELIWRLKPRQTGALKTNKLGLRDAPYNQDADVKILLLGDSVAWGDGVDDQGRIFPQLAEQMINSSDTGRTFEIINAAVPGYSTFQQLRYLELYGLDLNPDAVILQFCLNDVVERYSRLAEYGGDNSFLGVDTRDAVPGLYGWLVRHSRAFEAAARWAVQAGRNRQAYKVENMAVDEMTPELAEAWLQTVGEIDAIRELCAVNEIRFVMLIAPYRFQLADPPSTGQPQRRLVGYANSNAVPILNLLPYFAACHAENPGLVMFNDENHFSEVGHEFVARILVHRLVNGDQPVPVFWKRAP